MASKIAIQNQSFSPEQCLESLIYIVERLAKPTIHEALKIRYFSDKLHLGRFGSLGSGDDYVAMKFGPVASNTYNLIKAARGDQSSYINPYFYEIVNGALSIGADGKSMIVGRGVRLEYLSSAEVECIDEAIKKYGGLEFNERTSISHDSAWKKAWGTEGDEVGASPMSIPDIANTLSNADEVVSYISA